jgi:hypothetical protein
MEADSCDPTCPLLGVEWATGIRRTPVAVDFYHYLLITDRMRPWSISSIGSRRPSSGVSRESECGRRRRSRSSSMWKIATMIVTGTNRTYDWSGGRVYPDFEEERDATVAMISDDLRDADPDAS